MNKIILGIALLSIVGFCNVDAKAETFEPNNRYDQAQSIDSGTYHVDGSGPDWFSIQSTPGLIQLTMTPVGCYILMDCTRQYNIE